MAVLMKLEPMRMVLWKVSFKSEKKRPRGTTRGPADAQTQSIWSRGAANAIAVYYTPCGHQVLTPRTLRTHSQCISRESSMSRDKEYERHIRSLPVFRASVWELHVRWEFPSQDSREQSTTLESIWGPSACTIVAFWCWPSHWDATPFLHLSGRNAPSWERLWNDENQKLFRQSRHLVGACQFHQETTGSLVQVVCHVNSS